MLSDRLGTARIQSCAEVCKKYTYEPGSFWLGRAENGEAIGYSDDRHVCIVGGTRGGKGTSLIINNLCLWPGSAVVIDPKGENATITAARRGAGDEYCEGMGQTVHVLDPFNAANVKDDYRSTFNPLADLDIEDEETFEEAHRIAAAIVIVRENSTDPSWDEQARTLVRGVIMHVLSDDDFDGRRNLVTVAKLIQRGHEDLAISLRKVLPPEEKVDPPHLLLFKAMQQNRSFDGRVADIGSQFRAVYENAGKQFQGVLQSATSNTEFIDSPGMGRVLSGKGRTFQLSDLKRDPRGVTVYLSLPLRQLQNTHYRWLRMMLDLITTQMEITRGKAATKYPLLMMLDEFAALHRMDILQKAAPYIAGFGMKLCFVVQTYKQLHEVYKEAWETFLSNAGLKVLFSIEDNFTQDYVSKSIGETEIIRDVHSTNESQSRSDSEARGRSQTDTSSRSTTRGQSWSFADGLSSSQARGTSDSRSRSNTTGTNWSTSESENVSVGTSESYGTHQSSGGSSNFSFTGGQFNSSYGGSSSKGSSHNSGTNTTTGHGRSTSTGGSQSSTDGTTDGRSFTETQGRSTTHTEGYSAAETEGTSTAEGRSETYTQSQSQTAGTGRSEQILKRPLIQPDEIRRIFGRIDDPRDHFYPGLALAMVAGSDPLIIKRVNYFQDPLYIDCFSPDLENHKFQPAVEKTLTSIRPLVQLLEGSMKGRKLTISEWFIKEGSVLMPSSAVLEIKGVPPDNRTVRIGTPCMGKVTMTAALPQNRLSSGEYAIPDGPLFTVKAYPGSESGVDPVGQLRQACRDLPKLQESQESQPPTPKIPRQVVTPPAQKLSPSLLDWVVRLAFAVVIALMVSFGAGLMMSESNSVVTVYSASTIATAKPIAFWVAFIGFMGVFSLISKKRF
jgi:type IV secretory pathway TraG/TraD family ATPase VirD4